MIENIVFGILVVFLFATWWVIGSIEDNDRNMD
jgi:hypothetical protein